MSLDTFKNVLNKNVFTNYNCQSAGAVEYTDCFSTDVP